MIATSLLQSLQTLALTYNLNIKDLIGSGELNCITFYETAHNPRPEAFALGVADAFGAGRPLLVWAGSPAACPPPMAALVFFDTSSSSPGMPRVLLSTEAGCTEITELVFAKTPVGGPPYPPSEVWQDLSTSGGSYTLAPYHSLELAAVRFAVYGLPDPPGFPLVADTPQTIVERLNLDERFSNPEFFEFLKAVKPSDKDLLLFNDVQKPEPFRDWLPPTHYKHAWDFLRSYRRWPSLRELERGQVMEASLESHQVSFPVDLWVDIGGDTQIKVKPSKIWVSATSEARYPIDLVLSRDGTRYVERTPQKDSPIVGSDAFARRMRAVGRSTPLAVELALTYERYAGIQLDNDFFELILTCARQTLKNHSFLGDVAYEPLTNRLVFAPRSTFLGDIFSHEKLVDMPGLPLDMAPERVKATLFVEGTLPGKNWQETARPKSKMVPIGR